MMENIIIDHHIQKHILNVLTHKEFVRFIDMKPPKVETNLYSYHLKLMQKNGFVDKLDAGYGLSHSGMKYVNQLGYDDSHMHNQPTIIAMLLIQNSDGEVLLQMRNEQPYINCWALPQGIIDAEDVSIKSAALKIISEKLGLEQENIIHIGDAYIRVGDSSGILTSTLAHVFRFNRDDIIADESHIWVKPHKLERYRLAPAVEQIVARSFFNDPFFFEEYYIELGD